jgi:hypothetical protein
MQTNLLQLLAGPGKQKISGKKSPVSCVISGEIV